MTKLCPCAWAINMRSNGSRCGPGSLRARSASATVIASPSKLWLAMVAATPSAVMAPSGNLSSRYLVVISQAYAALTKMLFSSSAIAWYATLDRRALSTSHHRTCGYPTVPASTNGSKRSFSLEDIGLSLARCHAGDKPYDRFTATGDQDLFTSFSLRQPPQEMRPGFMDIDDSTMKWLS